MAHILITGGSRGIGAAMVRAFAREGHRVSFTYLHAKECANDLAEECGALAICADNADPSAVTAAVEAAREGCIKKPCSWAVIPNPHPETVRLAELSAKRLEKKQAASAPAKETASEEPAPVKKAPAKRNTTTTKKGDN